MSRSISQIYSEAVLRRNSYLQISPLNSGRSESKLSVINILTYIMAVLIYSYETLLDTFQVQIAQIINNRVNGTPAYYATMAKYFQFNPDTGGMDDIEFDDQTFRIKFKTVDENHRIIAKSAYQTYPERGLVIKVCKNNEDVSEADSNYMALTSAELSAFKEYMAQICFIGTNLSCVSIPGDLLSINANVVYDDAYIDEQQALDNIKSALSDYIRGLGFNSYVYYQSVIDAIQSAEHIVTVTGPNVSVDSGKYATVSLSEYDSDSGKYKEPETIVGGRTPLSGYLTFSDETQDEENTTLILDSSHLILTPNSKA